MRSSKLKLKQLLNIFAVLLYVVPSLSQTETAGSAQIIQGSIQPNVMPARFATGDQDPIVAFQVKQAILGTYMDGSHRINVELKKDDVVDMVLPDSILQESPLREQMGDEAYIPMVVGQLYRDRTMRVTIRSTEDINMVGRQLIIPGSSIEALNIIPVVDEDDGENLDTTTEADVCVNCERNAGARSPLTPTAERSAQEISAAAIDSAFSSYSDSSEIQRMIQLARRNLYTTNQRGQRVPRYIRTVRGRRSTYCYRAVKDALKGARVVDQNFGAGSGAATMARRDLLREGFTDLLQDPNYRNLMRNPDMAPAGAVLVYSGGRYGHVEIKTTGSGQGGYVSISETDNAAYGMQANGSRTLIGVMVKMN